MSPSHQRFLNHFRHLQRAFIRTHCLTALGGALSGLLLALLLTVVADFMWELSGPVRQWALAIAISGALFVACRGVWQAFHRWRSQSTAAALESSYPQLGQRVRTTIQFADESRSAHVGDQHVPHGGDFSGASAASAPTGTLAQSADRQLLQALSDQTDEYVAPLELDDVVPRARMRTALGLAACLVLLLMLLPLASWEWRTTVTRVLLKEIPFTTLRVKTGDALVREGDSLQLEFEVNGRPRDDVRLLSRPLSAEGGEWSTVSFSLDDATQADATKWNYELELPYLDQPLEYRIVAGPVHSPAYRIDVRYPLEIQAVNSTITPPTYTGLSENAVPDGNVTALYGSHIRCEVLLDRAPVSAEVVLNWIWRATQDNPDEQRSQIVPVTLDGARLTLEMDAEQDLTWSVSALAEDGSTLPEHLFRLRVQRDKPPRIAFQKPSEELEVHSLAEVPIRARATDDYGLTRSGIVFQINNGEEYTLLEDEFADLVETARELAAGSPIAPRTRATLEKILPFEYFELTQKDSVMYYAFAEDNLPSGPQRSESDWRFIDIRPFVMRFRERESMGGGGGGIARRQLPALDELIRRERYTLNRTVKLTRRDEQWGDDELNTIDRLVEYQAEIAALTREFADNLADQGIVSELDILYQAESSMLAAVDSLSVGSFANATIQEKDAQQYLVEARNRFLVEFAQNTQSRQAFAQANRRLQQKLRRNQQQAQLARNLARRLQQLARSQQQSSSIALGLMNAQNVQGGRNLTGQAATGAGSNPARPTPDEQQSGQGDETPETEQRSESSGDDEEAMSDPEDEPITDTTPEQLAQRLGDALIEAEDILDGLESVPGLTELVSERMQSGTGMIDAALGALDREKFSETATQTRRSAHLFDELAQQAKLLLAQDISGRISATRDLAAGLSQMERELAGEIQNGMSDAGPEPTESTQVPTPESLATSELAQRVSERASTIKDVVFAISQLNDPDLGNLGDDLADLAREQRVEETVQRIQSTARQVQTLPVSGRNESITVLEDTAERMDLLAAELDRMYRGLVVPRLALLRELEQRTSAAQQSMERQESPQDAAGWTREFENLLRDLDSARGGGAVREQLVTMMEERRLPGSDDWIKDAGTQMVLAPPELKTNVGLLLQEIQRQIHELILFDILVQRREATPPEYQKLVDRYFEVLAESPEQL